jgi:hypothetical protein
LSDLTLNKEKTGMALNKYNESRLKSPFRKFYCLCNDLVCDNRLKLADMLNDLFHILR